MGWCRVDCKNLENGLVYAGVPSFFGDCTRLMAQRSHPICRLLLSSVYCKSPLCNNSHTEISFCY